MMRLCFGLGLLLVGCGTGVVEPTATSAPMLPPTSSPIAKSPTEQPPPTVMATVVEEEAMTDETLEVRSGTYFGECLGYCDQTLLISAETTRYILSSNLPNEPDIVHEVKTDADLWRSLLEVLDRDQFRTLPDKIGCPDCYDQGGEWIEVSNGDIQHRVDIEFEAVVPELEAINQLLRPYRETLAEQFP